MVNCKTCGKKFTPSKFRPDQIYCSKPCKTRTEYHHVCVTCGTQFISMSKLQKNCSHSCACKSRAKLEKKMIFICEWCKNEFQEWAYRKSRFCSDHCRSVFAARQLKPNGRRPETMNISRKCLQCGNTYTTSIYQIKLRGSNFCSRKCMGEYQSKKLLKTGGPNYKGGVSKNNKYYRGQNWDRQRRAALKRDKRQCQICNTQVSSRDMHNIGVHHIKPYRFFNQDWESANALSNLITLCRSHHMKVEVGKIPCPIPKE